MDERDAAVTCGVDLGDLRSFCEAVLRHPEAIAALHRSVRELPML
jgi:hypothetical protein